MSASTILFRLTRACLLVVVLFFPAWFNRVSSAYPVSVQVQARTSTNLSPQTYHLAIPAAAFTPARGTYIYANQGRYLIHSNDPFDNDLGQYYAPLELPQGAVITRFTFYFNDPGIYTGSAEIRRAQDFSPSSITLAALDSLDTWPPGFGWNSTTSITTPVVDNANFSYAVVMFLPEGGAVYGCGIGIDYQLPQTAANPGYLSIPSAAFIPFYDGYEYTNVGHALTHNWGPGLTATEGWYLAPVHLPNGATISRFTFFWTRNTSVAGYAKLQRSTLGQDTFEEMAYATSGTGLGVLNGSDFDTSIASSLVDNSQYTYWVILVLPANNQGNNYYVAGDSIKIEYTLPASSSFVISVPAAEFRPYEDNYDFENHARHLIHLHTPGNSTSTGTYLAPVNLPDGAMVTRMRFNWYANSSPAGFAKFQRTEFNQGNVIDLAVAVTFTGGNGATYAANVNSDRIDNSRYAYWLVLEQPSNALFGVNIQGQAVTLEYAMPLFLPFISR